MVHREILRNVGAHTMAKQSQGQVGEMAFEVLVDLQGVVDNA